MKIKLTTSVLLVAFLAATGAFGQPYRIMAKIDFPFTVQGKVLPPGQYEFSRADQPSFFRVTDGSKISAMAPIITRISGDMHLTPEDAHVGFDKVGDVFILSEIWIPGEDGYVLAMTKEAHAHKVINIKR